MPKTYIIKSNNVYLYTTPNGKYFRFTSDRKYAMRMCEVCTVENMRWMDEMGMEPEKEEANNSFAVMPTCREHIK